MVRLGPRAPQWPAARRLGMAGFFLGFGLSGFFDGIILHQVLQWHHLLSGIAGDGSVPNLRFQILADGLFHVFTYAVTAIGLWLLWRSRAALDAPAAGTRLTGTGLIGFGTWHILDAVLSHWILGIHRIRMDTTIPLLWDLAWVFFFGVVAAFVGWRLLRRPPPKNGGGRHVRPGAAALSVVVCGAGTLAGLPPAGLPDDRALALFKSGMSLPGVAAAAEAVGGRPVWSDPAGGVWLIAFEPGARPSQLYRHGALLVSRGPITAGCLSWTTLSDEI